MFITDGVGKVGGHVVQRNHYGHFARTLVTPLNPQTTFQQDRRAEHEYLAQNWASLSSGERDAWEADSLNYPKTDALGDTYYLTGFNHYISLNLNLWAIGEAYIDTPGTKRIPADPGAFTITCTPSLTRFRLTYSAAPDDTDSVVIVYATDGISPGINYVSTKYRTIGTFEPDAVTTVFTLSTEYYAVFPAPLVGNAVFVKTIAYDKASGCPGLSRALKGSVT